MAIVLNYVIEIKYILTFILERWSTFMITAVNVLWTAVSVLLIKQINLFIRIIYKNDIYEYLSHIKETLNFYLFSKFGYKIKIDVDEICLDGKMNCRKTPCRQKIILVWSLH